jgi:putative oxidoreductase
VKIWSHPEIRAFPRRPVLCALALLTRLALAGVFLYAGVLKALDPGLFLLDVRSFQLLRDPWAAVLALGLPWLEIFAAVALGLGGWARGALLVMAGMLISFGIALVAAWGRGLDVTCGCFGASENRTNFPEVLTRDAVLLATVAFTAWVRPRLIRANPLNLKTANGRE